MKRVFNIYISICRTCYGTVKVNASIEHAVVIERILKHLEKKDASIEPFWLPHCWARRRQACSIEKHFITRPMQPAVTLMGATDWLSI
jgi:hypothetical protein